VEQADSDAIFTQPHHPYTEVLITAAPDPRVAARRRTHPTAGDVADSIQLPPSCAYHLRYPHAQERCCTELPQLR
jgi:peptide/nickel transport system ATP-binding protein